MPRLSQGLCHAEGVTIAPIMMGEGSTGVLLIHGYLATPEEMRGLAEHLAAKGIRVYAPLVAGHGTTMREFRRTRWEDWASSVESALIELQHECDSVFVVGISLGGLQALHLAAHHPGIRGIVALAPSVELMFNPRRPWRKASDMKLWLLSRMPWLAVLYKGEPSDCAPHFMHADIRDEAARLRHIYYRFNPTSGVLELLEYARQVKTELPQIRQPLLLIHSPQDGTVPVRSSKLVLASVHSVEKKLDLTIAANSWHVLTEDVDREAVYNAVSGFIARLQGGDWIWK
jgi:carboxylesterase